MRFAGFLSVLVVAGLGASVGSVQAVEQWALYDDFNGTTIDAAKWIGDEYYAHSGDANRVLLSGTLRMRYAGYGETTSNTSRTTSALLLHFINPAPITAVKATINVANYGMQGCPANPNKTLILATFSGSFFNAGTPTPGSELDNVYAYFRLQRYDSDAADTFVVEFRVYRCLDATCSTIDSYYNQPGTVPKGTPATMSVVWDKPNKKFIFQWGSYGREYGYPWSDSSPPVWELKRLRVQSGVPNCTAGPRPYGWITARFDDVYVNASALRAGVLRAPALPKDKPSSGADWR